MQYILFTKHNKVKWKRIIIRIHVKTKIYCTAIIKQGPNKGKHVDVLQNMEIYVANIKNNIIKINKVIILFILNEYKRRINKCN